MENNPFAIKKSGNKGILKINPTPIVCRTNCSSHGSITDPSGSKKFEGLQFFPLRIDKAEVFYEGEVERTFTKDILTFVLCVLAENCRVNDISSGDNLVTLSMGTVVYFQLKRNKSLSGSTDNFMQMKRMVEESGMMMTGCVFKPSFLPCQGVIKGKAVSYAKCQFNVVTAEKENHLKLLQELANLKDPEFKSVLAYDNEIMQHYDSLAIEYRSNQKAIAPAPERKALEGR